MSVPRVFRWALYVGSFAKVPPFLGSPGSRQNKQAFQLRVKGWEFLDGREFLPGQMWML